MRTLIGTLTLSVALFSPLVQSQTAPATPPSPSPPASAEPAAPSDNGATVGGSNRSLGDRIPLQQQLWLQAGVDRFFARYVGDLSGTPRGAVLILPDAGQHPSWPYTVAALLDDLPLH